VRILFWIVNCVVSCVMSISVGRTDIALKYNIRAPGSLIEGESMFSTNFNSMTLARLLILVWALISAVPVGVAGDADAPRVKGALILKSFGRDCGPFNAVLSSLCTELAQQSAVPIEFPEAFVGNHARTPGGSCGGLS
jgi:hypothetical protein